MVNSLEQFNQHQIDIKTRFNFLVQCVLLLAGGALTATVAVFTGEKAPKLDLLSSSLLACSWWLLVTCLCLAVLVMAIIILRDYFFAEEWRKQINNPKYSVDDSPGVTDKLIIGLGLLSLLAFLGGFILIAKVATKLLSP